MDIFTAIAPLDNALLQAIQAGINPTTTAVMLLITFLGHPAFWVGVSALLYWRSQENKAFFMMNFVAFASAAAGVLKHAFFRPRPSAESFQIIGSDDYGTQGFPSGHSTIIAAAFAFFYKKNKMMRNAVIGLVVLLVAFSRLYLGMHFPSDVVGGIVLGLVIGKANLFARDKLFHKNFKPTGLEEELALVGLVALAVLAVMFLRSFPMAGLFIGFYAGFFLFKEMDLDQSILLKKWLAIKYAIGFAFLGTIFLLGENALPIGMVFDHVGQFVLYAIGGFWISWIWPVLFEKLFQEIKQ